MEVAKATESNRLSGTLPQRRTRNVAIRNSPELSRFDWTHGSVPDFRRQTHTHCKEDAVTHLPIGPLGPLDTIAGPGPRLSPCGNRVHPNGPISRKS